MHELGHWTGHSSKLDRDQNGGFGSDAYAKEELVAEMAAAFTCASLGIAPTVRHSDYIASWLSAPRDDEKASFRAAKIGSASRRERVCEYGVSSVVAGILKKTNSEQTKYISILKN